MFSTRKFQNQITLQLSVIRRNEINGSKRFSLFLKNLLDMRNSLILAYMWTLKYLLLELHLLQQYSVIIMMDFAWKLNVQIPPVIYNHRHYILHTLHLNNVISSNFLVLKFHGNAQFPQSFERFGGNKQMEECKYLISRNICTNSLCNPATLCNPPT